MKKLKIFCAFLLAFAMTLPPYTEYALAEITSMREKAALTDSKENLNLVTQNEEEDTTTVTDTPTVDEEEYYADYVMFNYDYINALNYLYSLPYISKDISHFGEISIDMSTSSATYTMSYGTGMYYLFVYDAHKAPHYISAPAWFALQQVTSSDVRFFVESTPTEMGISDFPHYQLYNIARDSWTKEEIPINQTTVSYSLGGQTVLGTTLASASENNSTATLVFDTAAISGLNTVEFYYPEITYTYDEYSKEVKLLIHDVNYVDESVITAIGKLAGVYNTAMNRMVSFSAKHQIETTSTEIKFTLSDGYYLYGEVDDSLRDQLSLSLSTRTVDEVYNEDFYYDYVEDLHIIGVMYDDWSDPNQLDPNRLNKFYEYNVYYKDYENLAEQYLEVEGASEIYIPETVVEAHITQHFDVSTDFLRNADNYDEEKSAYRYLTFFGIGSSPLTVTAIQQTNDMYVVTCIDDGGIEFLLTMQITDSENYKYLSCVFSNEADRLYVQSIKSQ